MKTVVVRPDGEIFEKEINSYEEMCKTVGGYLETHRLGTCGDYFYINEEGKLLNLPLNGYATHICYKYKAGIRLNDCISGVMVVFGGPDGEGKEKDISEETKNELLSLKF